MKKKIKIKKIISFLLVLCMMMQLIPQSAIQINATSSGTTEIILNTAATDNIYLLTKDQFVRGDNVEAGSGEYCLKEDGDTEASKTVYIGDASYKETEYKGKEDITVDLKSVQKSLTLLQINPVSNGSYTTKLTVSGDSKIGELKIKDNAKAKITLNANLEISEISMGKGSELKIDSQGYQLKVAGKITGNGDITLTGKNLDIAGINADKLTLDSAELTANNKEISANEQLTVKNSTVGNASLLGYADNITGNKTLTFTGSANKLNEIKAVGTSETGKATVTIDGENTITASSDITYYCDYSLTYRNNEQELKAEEAWPVSYRTKFQGNMSGNATVVGYHNGAGTYKTADTITLPEYTEDGYNYVGWKIDNATVTQLPASKKGNQTLTAVLQSENVEVSLDLGYDPDEKTNDDYDQLKRVTKDNKEWGDSVNLPIPKRFGYRFSGWKVKSAENGEVYQNQTSYTVSMKDAEKLSNGGYQITLQAQWEAKEFPFRFLISGVDAGNIKVQVGTKVYDSITDFAEQYKDVVKWDKDSSMLEFSKIKYDEKLQAYMKRMGISEMPKLIDKRSGESKLDFSGWSTQGGNIADSDMSFTMESILDNKTEGETLESYEADITETPIFLTSQWGTASYTLTTDIADGWEILVDGEVQTPSALTKLKNTLSGNNTMSIKVKAGSEVTWRCSASDVQNFSLWNFTDGFLPEETKMVSGANYVSYTAKMPYKDVTATKSEVSETYIDISQSPITFEENVKLPSGRTVDGFWYKNKMTSSESNGMQINAMSPAFVGTTENSGHEGEYFYVWKKSDAFHMTSNGKETTNQLVLTNAITITVKNCKMSASDAYNENAVGSKIGDQELGDIFTRETGSVIATSLKNVQLKDYANILVDTTKTNAYTVVLNIEDDDSQIMDISTDGFHAASQYQGVIQLKGTGSTKKKLKLGTVFGDFKISMNNLEVTSYDKKDTDKAFDYAVYTSFTGAPSFKDCIVDMKERDIYTFDYSTTVDNTTFKARNLRLYYNGLLIYGNSNVHIYEDVYSYRHTITMSGNSNAVIDGNVVSVTQDIYASGKIETTGYLIVKGTVFDSGNTEFKKGTVICNILEVGSQTTFSSEARIITNMITGNVHNSMTLENGKYVLSNGSSMINSITKLTSNEDDYPFITYTPVSATQRNYTFGGDKTKIYLYGYYKVSNNYYDTTIKATDTDNPVNQWISQCIDNDGELKTGLGSSSLSDTELQNSIEDYTGSKDKECIILGNSTYTSQTEMPRNAIFSGANIYAAGNVTLFNDTTVSKGNISCNGSFGTKGELTVTGGTINADTVGNVGNITASKADMTQYWRKTKVSGGTINAKTIGARDSYGEKGTVQRSYVDITGGTIADGTTVRKDEYVNYIYDKNDFPDSQNSGLTFDDNVRMSTTWTTKLGDWTTTGIATLPVLTDSTGTKGSWAYATTSGPEITGIGTNGQVLPEASDIQYVQDNDQIVLYATKSQYTLTKVYGTSDYSLSVDGDSNIGFKNITMTDIADMTTKDVPQADIKKGAKIKLTVTDEKYKDRTVVWYKDGNGQYHNALSNAQWEGSSITFDMPNGNTYIYVVEENQQLPLDLYASGLSFTKDGFITEYASVDSNGDLSAENKENVFKYSGDYKIVQSNLKENSIEGNNDKNLVLNSGTSTSNRIRFAKDFDNLDDTQNDVQKIYVHRVYQQCEDALMGVVMEDGANVKLQIEGKNTLFRFSLKEKSKLDISGKTGNSTDVLYFLKATSNVPRYNSTIIGNVNQGNYGKTGDCVIENLDMRMRSGYAGYLMYGATSSGQGTLTIDNCKLDRSIWGDTGAIGINLKDVTIKQSLFKLPCATSHTTALFQDCTNVTIKDHSEIHWTKVGSTNTGGHPIDYGIKDTLTIDNSTVEVVYESKMTAGTMLVNEGATAKAKKVLLKNNADVKIDSRAVFNSLEVTSGAKFTVNQVNSEDTYLLCPNVTVDGGTINTDYLVVSGYHHPGTTGSADYAASKAALDNKIKQKNNMEDGANNTGLVIKDGTVNADKFVGGDMNGKITVQGGTLKSAQIGTSGKLFGFTKPLPANQTDFVYQYDILDYSNYTQSCNVKIAGGTVNVAENGYLGGMNSTVELTGGAVKLADQAVLGMTDKQASTLKDYYSAKSDNIESHENCNVNIAGGSITQADGDNVVGNISAPYGKISISGQNAKVKIAKMSSDHGTIEITKANDAYDNPYTGNEQGTYKSERIGVWVTDTLSAQTIKISDGAQVYAQYAYAQITNDQGVLSVKEAALYSDSYGEKGIVRNHDEKQYNDTPNAEFQTVFGTKMVTVSYDLNPNGVIFDSDLAEIENQNPESYTVSGTDTKITLTDLTSAGYEFKGWYNSKDCSGEAVTSLNTSIPNDLTLYAKWEKVKVKFKIIMDADSSEFEGNSNWTPEGNSYVYTKQPEITYGDKILSVSGANLKDYTSNTMGATELEISESGYTGTKAVNADTIVTKELAKYYKENNIDAITLRISKVQKRYATVRFSLNQKDGKPVDAKFDQASIGVAATMEREDNIGVDQQLKNTDKFADATVKDTKSIGLIKPSATGYTFIGWNTDPDATQKTTDGWVTAEDTFKVNTTVYAIWQANTYKIEFNAGAGRWVTSSQTEPAVGAESKNSLCYYWRYDTPISEENSFWIKEEGTEDKYMQNLPYAWKEGSTFDNAKGWTYSYKENEQTISGQIDSTKVLSGIFIKALDVSVGSPDGTPESTALTLTASYTPVKVTYDRNGGEWTNTDNKDETEPEYGEALYGYTEGTAVDPEEVVTTVTGDNGKTYQVRSTTADSFNTNKSFIANDYRKQLSRKGYTFKGWVDENNKEVGTTPRFEDVKLKAKWTANSYSLTLNSLENGKDSNYSYFNTGSAASIKNISVKVGEEIKSSDWPSRSGDWYAYNNTDTSVTDNKKRYLLGFTFQPLDPGSTLQKEEEGYSDEGHTAYQNYAQTITNMQNNSKTLYQSSVTSGDSTTEGTIFQLPEDGSYAEDIKGSVGSDSSYEVPDYPDGCNIEMYAVYRERSLVFVERYIDPDGNVKQQVKYSTAWNEWSDYPENKYGSEGNSKITDQGYSLMGWYVNGTTAVTPYPTTKESYDKQCESFKQTAQNLGTYDIMVYTVYVAQVERSDITLTAKKDPTSKELSTNSYTLPSSMQSGNLSLEVTSKGDSLKLVSKAEMEANEYKQTWTDSDGTTHTSDDTVAIVASISKGNITKEVELSAVLNGKGDFNQQVEAGWQLTFTLYHSKVMTKESNYEVDVKAKFSSTDSGSSLDNQWILNKIQVKLQPSEYKVRYKINLPEETKNLTITETEDFKRPTDENADVITKEVTLGYGSTLSDNLPTIEGYTAANAWKYTDSDGAESDDVYQKLTMKVNAKNQGVIDLTRDYTAKTYELSADDQTLTTWDITYGNGANNTTASPLSSEKKAVKYHSLITFTPKTSQTGSVPEFITLTLGSGEEKKVKLSEYAAKDETTGAYTFKMPAESVAASYVTEETMYLEEGTISITEDGYTQDKATGFVDKKWPGNYVILQNKGNDASQATDHQLILNGNLSTKKIQIGNLNISKEDSVQLKAKTNAKITMGDQTNVSALTAKNIKVPQTSQFSCEPEQDQTGSKQMALVGLSPDKDTAAIGDAKGNGTITLDYLKISTVMPTASKASAIGSDSESQTAGDDIKLTNSELIVDESSDTSTYQGTWIGGKSVTNVTVDKTTINKKNDKNMAGPLITNADNVNISNSTIGTQQQPVTDPVYAKDKLNIDNSSIYQIIQNNITNNQEGNSPVGTADGTTQITDSKINTTTSGSLSKMKDLYSGSMYIKDAKSDVTIDGNQLVELSNGSVEIKTTAYDQGQVSHEAKNGRRNYVLLEEGNVTQSTPNLTVTSMAANTNIEVRQPSGKNDNTSNVVTAGDLKTATNMNLVLKGNLTLTGTAQITDAAGKDIKVTSNDNNADHTLKITGDAFTENTGSYTQTGGKLESTSNIGSGKLDVKLDSTQVDTKNLYAKNLTLDSSIVKATEAVGSKPDSSENAKDVTKVSINNTTVNAAEIGALGTYDKTFTIVKADSSSLLTGKVIKDEYRMTYDKNGGTFNTESLPKVLRTSTPFTNGQSNGQTTVKPDNGIPEDPSGDTNTLFSGWYINEKDADNNAVRKALKVNGTLPGIKKTTTLNADTISKLISADITSNTDDTKTITVHAWLNATGKVVIEKGRKFVATSTTTTETTIQANGAWTAQLTSSGTFIDGRDYQAEFSQPLPEGTKLTLTIPKTTQSAGKYYYYDVTGNTTKTVKFSDFEAMGTNRKFKSETYDSGAIPENEVYLLSADYAQTAHSAANRQTVITFKLLPEDTSELTLGNNVTYNLSSVSKGEISVAGQTVTISKLPSDDDNLSGQKLYVKAVFKKNNTSNDEATIPFNTNATLGTTKGKWISRDTVVFELGNYESVQPSSQTYNFDGLTLSDYKITWSLVYGDGSSNNIVGNVVSN